MVLTIGGEVEREAVGVVYERVLQSREDTPIFKGLGSRTVAAFGVSFRSGYQEMPHYEPVLMLAEAPRMTPRAIASVLIPGHLELDVQGMSATVTLDGLDPADYFAGQ